MMAGKGHDVLTIHGQKPEASTGKKDRILPAPQWGIDVPSCRLWGESPTCGSLGLFFCRKSTTRSSYGMHLSHVSLRGAERGHIWKQHHGIACFWKMMKSIFQL